MLSLIVRSPFVLLKSFSGQLSYVLAEDDINVAKTKHCLRTLAFLRRGRKKILVDIRSLERNWRKVHGPSNGVWEPLAAISVMILVVRRFVCAVIANKTGTGWTSCRYKPAGRSCQIVRFVNTRKSKFLVAFFFFPPFFSGRSAERPASKKLWRIWC